MRQSLHKCFWKTLKTAFLFITYETLFKKMEKALADALEMAEKEIKKGKEKEKRKERASSISILKNS